MTKQMTVGAILGMGTPAPPKPSPHFITPTRFGVEIEIEDTILDLETPLWKVERDGSLRNGYEYLFSGPLDGDKGYQALMQYHEAAKDNLGSDNMGHRTSIHIHIDVRDMTMEQVFTMTLAYISMEAILFEYLDNPFRENNIYCVRLQKMRRFLDHLQTGLHSANYEYLITDKYTAYNTSRLRDLGTVEFRMFPCTSDGHKIVEWANICMCFKKYALEHTTTELMAMVYGDPSSLQSEILRPVYPLFAEAPHDLVMKGVYTLQSMSISSRDACPKEIKELPRCSHSVREGARRGGVTATEIRRSGRYPVGTPMMDMPMEWSISPTTEETIRAVYERFDVPSRVTPASPTATMAPTPIEIDDDDEDEF